MRIASGVGAGTHSAVHDATPAINSENKVVSINDNDSNAPNAAETVANVVRRFFRESPCSPTRSADDPRRNERLRVWSRGTMKKVDLS